MIRAEYVPHEHTLLVRGHAGSGDPGRDLVCAGVSALVLALREELLQLEEEGMVNIRRLQLEPGYADIRCIPAAKGEGTERLSGIWVWPNKTPSARFLSAR